MRQALTLLATIELKHHGMNRWPSFNSGAAHDFRAAYTDQVLTGNRQAAQRTN
jgi:hypothetical protein